MNNETYQSESSANHFLLESEQSDVSLWDYDLSLQQTLYLAASYGYAQKWDQR